MTKIKSQRGTLRLMILVVAIAVVVAAAATVLGQTGQGKEKGSWQDLVMIYTTDIKGKIEPCG